MFKVWFSSVTSSIKAFELKQMLHNYIQTDSFVKSAYLSHRRYVFVSAVLRLIKNCKFVAVIFYGLRFGYKRPVNIINVSDRIENACAILKNRSTFICQKGYKIELCGIFSSIFEFIFIKF